MNDLKKLWAYRFSGFWGHAIFYLRTIITGYMYIPILIMILLAFFYNYLLREWKESGLIVALLALLLTWILSRSDTRTFLKEADLIFILPLEKKLHHYFRLSLYYSFVVHALVTFLFMLLISPLYSGLIDRNEEHFYPIVAALVAWKGWNVLSQWQEQRWRNPSVRRYHAVLRWGCNLWVSAAVFSSIELYPYALGSILFILSWSYYRASKKNGYNLIRLVQIEERMKARFYGFVQWFMDIPQLGYQVKRREWWISLFSWIPFHSSKSYHYLFSRSFIRYTDLFQLYWRVSIAGMLFLYFIESRYVTFFVFFALLLINGIQLSNAWPRLHASFWSAIYPVSGEWKERGFIQVLFLLLAVQAAMMSIVLWFRQGWLDSLIMLAIGFLFCYLFSFFFLIRRLRGRLPGL